MSSNKKIIACLIFSLSFFSVNEKTSAESAKNIIKKSAPEIPIFVAAEASAALDCAKMRGFGRNATKIAVIDYTKPSSQKRMWVIDLSKKKLIYKEYVAHGQGSGDLLAKKFSNKSNSHATSLGLFVTDEVYNGRNGYSLRMDGLNYGLNNYARDRAIVIHGADYVRPENGFIGRSWGCPALRRSVAKPIIDTLKDGQFVYAFGPGSSASASCLWNASTIKK